jgi:fructose-specific phosphotransferase system component IIB
MYNYINHKNFLLFLILLGFNKNCCLKRTCISVDTRGACGFHSKINVDQISTHEREILANFNQFMENTTSELGTYLYCYED